MHSWFSETRSHQSQHRLCKRTKLGVGLAYTPLHPPRLRWEWGHQRNAQRWAWRVCVEQNSDFSRCLSYYLLFPFRATILKTGWKAIYISDSNNNIFTILQKIELVYEKVRETVNNRIGSQMHLLTPSQAQALLIDQRVEGRTVAGTVPPVWLKKNEALAQSPLAEEAFYQVQTCLRNKQIILLPLPMGTNQAGHYMLYVCLKNVLHF